MPNLRFFVTLSRELLTEKHLSVIICKSYWPFSGFSFLIQCNILRRDSREHVLFVLEFVSDATFDAVCARDLNRQLPRQILQSFYLMVKFSLW